MKEFLSKIKLFLLVLFIAVFFIGTAMVIVSIAIFLTILLGAFCLTPINFILLIGILISGLILSMSSVKLTDNLKGKDE
jgi:hypothetical protein